MTYRFNDCEIDPETHCLTVGGIPRDVEPQVFDLLVFMARNPGRLISHDELIQEIWQGRIVSDSAISARISAARAAVDDDGKRQQVIKTVPRRGFQFVAVPENAPVVTRARGESNPDVSRQDGQRIRFCQSGDGTQIAYASIGQGYPLVRAGHWLTHLEHDWHSPIWRPFLNALSERFRVALYDQRGNGLSDWSVDDFTLDRFVDDLAAVVDAAGLDRFALYGTSQGAPISIAYAVRYPERVSHLILHGGYAVGRLVRKSEAEREQGHALLTLIRHGWGKPGSAFIKSFASMYIPDGSSEQIASLADLQRVSTSPENAARLREAVDNFNVQSLLGEVQVPTLVIHARNDGVHPLGQGRKLAAGIRGAEFLMLESSNHTILEQEPAWQVLLNELHTFALA